MKYIFSIEFPKQYSAKVQCDNQRCLEFEESRTGFEACTNGYAEVHKEILDGELRI